MNEPEKIYYPQTISWVLYDLANTIFSMNVVSLYFATWITIDLGKQELWFGAANSISQLMVVLSVPLLGFLADHRNKNGTFLRIMTLVCIFATAAISGISLFGFNITTAMLIGLFLYMIANYGYQSGLVFYNAFLPGLAPRKYIGKISGMGVAVGYIGSAIGLILVMPFNEGMLFSYNVPFIEGGGRIATFLPTAFLFLIFAIPALLMLKNRPEPPSGTGTKFEGIIKYYKNLIKLLTRDKEGKTIGRFLIAKFFFQEAVETIIIFMAVYSQKVIGFTSDESSQFFIVIIPAAVIGSLACGWIVDRIGPHKTLRRVVIGWFFTLMLIVITSGRGWFWAGGVFAGIFLGSTWTAARPMMISLVKPENISEAFGLYALSGKMSAVTGPLVWGLVVLLFDSFGTVIQHKAAIMSLMVMLAIGYVLLRKVPDNHSPVPGQNDR